MKSYDQLVCDGLQEVKKGQHLRFIKPLFRTKEVCLAAVDYESYNTMMFDIHSVPYGNLDYVLEQMKLIKKDAYYLKKLSDVVDKRKEEYKAESYPVALKYYNAIDYDDMCNKIYNLILLKEIYKNFGLFNKSNLIKDVKYLIFQFYIKL